MPFYTSEPGRTRPGAPHPRFDSPLKAAAKVTPVNQLHGLWRALQAWPKEARAEDTEPESTARTVWVIPNTYPQVSMSRASVRRLNYEKVL